LATAHRILVLALLLQIVENRVSEFWVGARKALKFLVHAFVHIREGANISLRLCAARTQRLFQANPEVGGGRITGALYAAN
jgi:hypothetical protein